MIKKIFKYLGLLILGILLALIVAPFFLKDEIIAEIKKQVNQNINADVDWKNTDISFLKSFPQVNIALSDLSVIGRDTFQDIPLLKAKALSLDFNIMPFIDKSKPMSMTYLGVKNADIHIIKMNDTIANYLITKPSGDTSKFNMALEKYELINSNLLYVDHSLALKLNARRVNHEGKGDLGSDVFDLDTNTEIDSLSVLFDGFNYLKNIKSKLKAKINMDFAQQKFTLRENTISLNKWQASGDGLVQFLNENEMKVIVNVKSENQPFAHFLSIVPYMSAYNTVKADGKASFNVHVEGIYNGLNGHLPAFDIQTKIANGSAQYAGLAQPIKNVQADIKISSKHPLMKDLMVNIKQCSASVGTEKIAGQFFITDGMSDPHINGSFNADVHLENWATAIPIENVEQIKGAINGNAQFDARQSDIDHQRYSAIQFNGKLIAQNILWQMKDKPQVTIGMADMSASPQLIKLNTQDVKFGKSDANFSGTLNNPLAYFSEQKDIQGDITLSSSLLDLNEWMSEEKTTESNVLSPDISTFKFSAVNVNTKIDKILFGNHQIAQLSGQGKLGLENVDITSFRANIDGSDIAFNGKLANVYSYLFNNETLIGDLTINSKDLNANQFMSKSSDQEVSADSMIFMVPERIDITLHSSIEKLTYTNLELKNFNGTAKIKDQSVLLTGLNAQTLGGKMTFDGLYATKNKQPDFNIKLDLAKMEFLKTYEKFVSMKQLAPLAQYIQGVFNTTLVIEGQLGKGMTPVLSNITASGFLETLNGIVKGFKPLQAVGDKLGLAPLSNLEIKDSKNWFDVKNGVVEVKEFTKNIGGIDVKMGGKHKIQGPMDYTFFLRIPRAMLKKNAVTGAAEKGLSFLEKEAQKKGISIAQGEYIDVKVALAGRISSPTVSIIPLGTSGKSMQEEIKEEVKLQTEKAKDSINKVVTSAVIKAKDSIRNRAEVELDKAKKQAETKAAEVLNETKTKVQKEVEKKLDTLVGKTVSDSLSKKAGQIIKDKTGKEVDDIKNKVKDWNPFKKKKNGGG